MTTKQMRPRSPAASPLRNPLTLLRQEIDDLLSHFWDGDPEHRWSAGSYCPAVDLAENESAFELRMDIPGMDPQAIDVQVHGNTVTLSGKREEPSEERGMTFRRIERRSGSFSRTLALPCAVNEDEVAAEYTHGVLVVTLPKCDEAKTKKVAVVGD